MQTPSSNRLHVAIFGDTNSGKSSIFNKLIGQEISIVSEISGTTTDPVSKAIEFLPFGPIVLIDTAGLSDFSALGEKRIDKTKTVLNRTDLALYIIDCENYNKEVFAEFKKLFKEFNIPYITVLNKEDKHSNAEENFENAISVSALDDKKIQDLREKIISELNKIQNETKEPSLSAYLKQSSTVVLVIPIDSEAPKGRIILPQVQIIRDCLDNNIKCIITNENTISEVFEQCKNIDIVITDSKIFPLVNKIVPKDILLTSFSVLLAEQKGDLKTFIEGAKAVNNLKDGDTVLIAETCTHTHNHEDIGQVIIPNAIRKITGKQINFEFLYGKEFSISDKNYSLIIHCGGCMVTRRELLSRIKISADNKIPITNYGLVLSLASGILERTVEFTQNNTKD